MSHSNDQALHSPMAQKSEGIFSEVPSVPPNPVFHMMSRYRADTNPNKIDLSVGAYRDEELRPYVFDVVKEAEKRLAENIAPKEYLPIDGLPELHSCSQQLVFGANSQALASGRVATCQSLSGTGALRLAADFLYRMTSGADVYLSDPTWENHFSIFRDAGYQSGDKVEGPETGQIKYYRYYNPNTCMLDFEGLCEDLRNAPRGSIVLLHACAHNPTGVDPTHKQWKTIAEILKDKEHIPLFDLAYQGFASGDTEQDAYAVRLFEEMKFNMIICQSYAKNLGLYNERVGCIHVVTDSSSSAQAVASQLKRIIRPMYSNPPAHGAHIVCTILSEDNLRVRWQAELQKVVARIHSVRKQLHNALSNSAPGEWDHIVRQQGMFSFTGLTAAQCAKLTDEHHIYLLDSGRISIAGLNSKTVPVFVDAVKSVLSTSK